MLDAGIITFIVSVSILLVVGLVSLGMVLRVRLKGKGWDDTGWLVPTVLSGFFLTLVLIISSFALYPYNIKYVTWVPKEGIVASVTQSADVNTGQVDGLRITLGDGTAFVTDDFRLAQVREGQKVDLSCLPRPVSHSADAYKCVDGVK